MCLYTTQSEPKIAEEDIIVYKFMMLVDGILLSPYREVAYDLGVEAKSRLICEESDSDDGYCIEEGIHSFITKDMALRYCYKYQLVLHVPVECIIPKGAQYFEGKFNEHQSIASNKLTITRILD